MNTIELISMLLVFLVATGTTLFIMSKVLANKTQQRLASLNKPEEGESWTETLIKLAGPLAKITAPDGDWHKSPIRVKFMQAGWKSEDAPTLFFGAKTALAAGFAVTLYIGLQVTGSSLHGNPLILTVLLAAMAGFYLPNLVLRRAITRRTRELFEAFPNAADLLLVCVESGLGLDAALTKVTEEMALQSPVLAQELHIVNLEIRAGLSRAQALKNLATRTGISEIGVFTTMLIQADKFGTSMGDAIRVFSDDLRDKRMQRAEEVAAKVQTKMLFPLVVCIFPAISMVILGPAGIRIVKVIMPLIAGGA
jgi:tight adherence protein C